MKSFDPYLGELIPALPYSISLNLFLLAGTAQFKRDAARKQRSNWGETARSWKADSSEQTKSLPVGGERPPPGCGRLPSSSHQAASLVSTGLIPAGRAPPASVLRWAGMHLRFRSLEPQSYRLASRTCRDS